MIRVLNPLYLQLMGDRCLAKPYERTIVEWVESVFDGRFISSFIEFFLVSDRGCWAFRWYFVGAGSVVSAVGTCVYTCDRHFNDGGDRQRTDQLDRQATQTLGLAKCCKTLQMVLQINAPLGRQACFCERNGDRVSNIDEGKL